MTQSQRHINEMARETLYAYCGGCGFCHESPFHTAEHEPDLEEAA